MTGTVAAPAAPTPAYHVGQWVAYRGRPRPMRITHIHYARDHEDRVRVCYWIEGVGGCALISETLLAPTAAPTPAHASARDARFAFDEAEEAR